VGIDIMFLLLIDRLGDRSWLLLWSATSFGACYFAQCLPLCSVLASLFSACYLCGGLANS
jgi:hypothetical protein